MNYPHKLQRDAIRRSNKPLNKYSEAVHQNTENLTDDVSDRGAYDVGTEMEPLTNKQ